MNYTTLFATIKGYVENDFPAASYTNVAGTGTTGLTSTEQINTFIRQAEQRIYNTVQLPALRKNVTGTCLAGNQYLGMPADWLAMFSLAVIQPSGSITGGQSFLLNKDVEFIRESFPFPAVIGVPSHYAIFDANTCILGPTPDNNYSFEMHYYYYPESIVTANTTWLGTNFDSALLYGSLLEGYTYMKGETDVIANYQKRYDESMALLKQLGDGKDRQDMYRTGQVRYPVK
jgi:hypothetical protein